MAAWRRQENSGQQRLGEWAAEHLSNTGPVEDKQVPKHLEINNTELFKTKNEGPIKTSFDPWKTLAQISILRSWQIIRCSKKPTSVALPNSLFSLMGRLAWGIGQKQLIMTKGVEESILTKFAGGTELEGLQGLGRVGSKFKRVFTDQRDVPKLTRWVLVAT